MGHRRYGHQAIELALRVLIGAVHIRFRYLAVRSPHMLTFAGISSVVIDGGTLWLLQKWYFCRGPSKRDQSN